MNFVADTPRLEIFRLAGIPIKVDITFILVPIFCSASCSSRRSSSGPHSVDYRRRFSFGTVTRTRTRSGRQAFRRSGRRNPRRRLLRLYANARSRASTAANVINPLRRPPGQCLLFFRCWNALGLPDVGSTGRIGPHRSSHAGSKPTWMIHAALTFARINWRCWCLICSGVPSRRRPNLPGCARRRAPRAVAIRIIAVLGVVVGLWTALAGLPHGHRAASDRRPNRDHQLGDPEATRRGRAV